MLTATAQNDPKTSNSHLNGPLHYCQRLVIMGSVATPCLTLIVALVSS